MLPRSPDVGGLPFPTIWVLLACNVAFGYGCKQLCTRLIAHKEGGSLRTTLVLTVQKFVAFVISVSSNPALRASRLLWLGAAAVLAGSFLFSTAPPHKPRMVYSKKGI